MSVRFPKPYTFRSEKYLKFVRSLPCCACGTNLEVEAHHTETGGMALRGSDGFCIPLCAPCHRAHDAEGKVSFYKNRGLDRWELVARTLEKFVKEVLS